MNPLEVLRKKIDVLDALILKNLEDRLLISKEIIGAKKNKNLPLLHLKREQELLKKLSDQFSLGEKIIPIYKEIIALSRLFQENKPFYLIENEAVLSTLALNHFMGSTPNCHYIDHLSQLPSFKKIEKFYLYLSLKNLRKIDFVFLKNNTGYLIPLLSHILPIHKPLNFLLLSNDLNITSPLKISYKEENSQLNNKIISTHPCIDDPLSALYLYQDGEI